jgi:hypothetical protein
LFEKPDYRIFKHKRTVSVDDWTAEITTHSPIMNLDNTAANNLVLELSNKAKSKVGGSIQIEHDTHALIAKRRF